MPLIPFPNVPKLPGVPAIPRSSQFPPAVAASLGVIQGTLWRAARTSGQWGIFDAKGKALGDPASFVGPVGAILGAIGIGATLSTGGIDYTKETAVSDFPVEKGSSASYNKVERAATPSVTLCMAGSEKDRRAFLEAVDKATKSTDLYSVVTPEVTYINYAIESYNYQRRSAKGATLLMVDVSLKEIREVSAQYAQASQIQNPKDAGATPTADNGKVQAKTPEVSTLKSLANKIPELGDTISSFIHGLSP